MIISSCPSGIPRVAEAGFENVFLDMKICCSEYELETVGTEEAEKRRQARRQKEQEKGKAIPEPVSEKTTEMARHLRGWFKACRKHGVNVPIARAPYLLRRTERTDLNGLMKRIAVQSIRYCGKIGCDTLIVRPLFAGVSPGKEWEANRKYYLSLGALAKEKGVMLLLENQCVDRDGHFVRGICSDAVIAARWIDQLNREMGEERFGFCMDAGTCMLCRQDIQEFVTVLGNRVKAVILRDCDVDNETSRMPFSSIYSWQHQTDWLGLIRGLRAIDFDGHLVLDAYATVNVISPLLRTQTLALGKEIADHFAWQIGIEKAMKRYDKRVLFGAGNMCRNYMKCYGDTYPPLFTCDNDDERWGDEFCGLEIKPPEVLKDIPEDCGVFICNLHYDEIQEQLEEMGIRNIERFSDEYLPFVPEDLEE